MNTREILDFIYTNIHKTHRVTYKDGKVVNGLFTGFPDDGSELSSENKYRFVHAHQIIAFTKTPVKSLTEIININDIEKVELMPEEMWQTIY